MVQRSIAVALAPSTAMLLLALGGTSAEAKARTEKSAIRRSNLPPGWRWPPSRETRREGRKCMRDLRGLGVRFKGAPRRRMIATPVLVPDMTFGAVTLRPTYRKPPFVMDCRLARAIATQADRLAALGIRELRFSSIYDYRRVRFHHRVHRALSRHALGLAMDVFQVELVGGAVLDVDRDYWSSPVLIVTELALRASGGFREVLSPAVDPISHNDHIHIEAKAEQPVDRASAQKRRARQARRTAPE
ncbi:MAG TPA: extensin family protein [Kofleriaceae bacterium]|nr:extensin family protein [Kofleriaceae bacterium]